MRNVKEKIKENWYVYLTEIVIFVQLAVFLYFGENSYVAVHDNLDLFVDHFMIMKRTGTFFSDRATIPMLGGLSRDLFGSQFSLYNILFYFFKPFTAYILGYFLKIFIGLISFNMLIKEIYPNTYNKYLPISTLSGLAYGLIPVFPAYGIAFTSVPLLLVLLRRLYMDDKKVSAGKLEDKTDKKATIIYRGMLYAGVFIYPLLSYFSYHGFFLLAYMCAAVIILWIKDRKFPKSTAISVVVLACGFVCFEYRLFREMLFGDTVTIRSTMVGGNLSLAGALKQAGESLLKPVFHGEDSHLYLVLPVCVIGLVIINFVYIKKKEWGGICKDSCNQTFAIILFNSLIYGLYDFAPFRNLIETIIPKLEGFQLNRTIFFNPFLWYFLLFNVLKRLYDINKSKLKIYTNIITVIAVMVVMFEPQVYNDFYYTCYNQAFKIIKHKETSTLNFKEFYSTELFEKIKMDLNYNDEWSVAYGMHPAVLGYNGISTLDGYLGMYSVEYKEKFRAVIAPALESATEFREYFDSWGARAYIYSDEDQNTYNPYRNVDDLDTTLSIDTDALRELKCKYIFSRVMVTNANDLGISLRGMYKDEESPYNIFVYTLD